MEIVLNLFFLFCFIVMVKRILDVKNPSLLTKVADKFTNFSQQIFVVSCMLIWIFMLIIDYIVCYIVGYISNNIDPSGYFLQFVSIIIWILARFSFNHIMYLSWKWSFKYTCKKSAKKEAKDICNKNLTNDSYIYIYRFRQSHNLEDFPSKDSHHRNDIVFNNEYDNINNTPLPYTENELSGWIIICLSLIALLSYVRHLPELTESCIILILGKLFWIEIPEWQNIRAMFTKRVLFLGTITFISVLIVL